MKRVTLRVPWGAVAATAILLSPAALQAEPASTGVAVRAGEQVPPSPSAPPEPAETSLPPILNTGISGNPAAVNITTGTGWLGRTLGIPEDTGVTLGGLYIADANYLFTGGQFPHRTTGNSLLILDVHADLEKGLGWKGASVGADFLQYNGGPSNENAGLVQGYNSLEASTPLDRTELYQLWIRQAFLDNKLILRLGKVLANYDFGNVIEPVNPANPDMAIPAVSGLLFTPLYVNSSYLGVMPGYYDSAYGAVINYAPTKNLYANFGVYDGNGARGVRTGNRLLPEFSGYYFTIGEVGACWALGDEGKPGIAAIGGWGQSGSLGSAGGPQEDGAQGLYGFASQQLWYQDPGKSNAGFGAYGQFGWNGSDTLPMNWYVGGGLTSYGILPSRPRDSIGAGFAWAGLNPNLYQRDTELLLQGYYIAHLWGSIHLQGALSWSPAPGGSPEYNAALTGTMRLVVVF